MYVLLGFFGGNWGTPAAWPTVEVMTASSFAHRRRTVRSAVHRHPGKRPAGRTRWGTGLAGLVVGTMVIAGVAWAAGPGTGATGHAGPRVLVSITAAGVSGVRAVYPGGTGDVVVAIANPNTVSVRVTALDLPSDTTYATGFTNSAHTTRRAGCSAATSGVVWNGSARARTIAARLAVPLVIGAHHTVNVTLANGVYMKATAPAACEATYFMMPRLMGVGARTDAHARTSAPAVDTWIRLSR